MSALYAHFIQHIAELSSTKSEGSVLDPLVFGDCRRGAKSQYKTHTKRAGGGHGVPPEEEDCSVCLNRLSQGDTTEWPGRCKHKFHVACLVGWRREQNQATCPLCRDAVEEEDHETCAHCGARASRSSTWSDAIDGYPCLLT
ncbi:RING zinc finger domain superfamily protein [Puccinia sorghi]|uniref:RING zinc finger domain superfamily protein n=1 Tax=Puccinia sorghi TaxID=27349 RepID=A0A0L6VRE2_9BASI|nr:RING zinc finger domain superfamily protein [Puccinia sorghi]